MTHHSTQRGKLDRASGSAKMPAGAFSSERQLYGPLEKEVRTCIDL